MKSTLGKVRFFYLHKPFRVKNSNKIKEWISNSIVEEGKSLDQLFYYFVSDEQILEINKEHLQHDFYTDVITFDYTNKNKISGEVFISIERVKENAQNMHVPFEQELHRVLIHAVLHLCGYKDKKDAEVLAIRKKEDKYIYALCST